MEFGSAGADRGLLKEFEAIIAVVIGGALLTGGYGSVIALGALIFGVVQQGLFFAGVESSLFRVFLGVLLLAAVILNTYIRRIITGENDHGSIVRNAGCRETFWDGHSSWGCQFFCFGR